jgi:hypothetical protein
MAKGTSTLIGIIIHPVKTTRMTLLGKPGRIAFAVLAGFLMSYFLADWMNHANIWMEHPPSFFQLLPFKILALMFVLAVTSGMIHLSADILGGGGRAVTLFFLLLMSLLPLWLYGPFASLLIFLNLPAWIWLVEWVLGAWSFVLFLICIRELYRFDLLKTFLTVAMPALFMLIIGISVYYCSASNLRTMFGL